MISIWTIIRWFHLLAAMVWIGGIIFIVAVIVPVVRSTVSSQYERTLITAQVGRRFGMISGLTLVVLVVTGFLNAEHANVDWSNLTATEYGETLLIKLILVALVVAVTFVHSFYYGTRLERLAAEARERLDEDIGARQARLQRQSAALSGVNLLLNLAVVLFAVALVT